MQTQQTLFDPLCFSIPRQIHMILKNLIIIFLCVMENPQNIY